MNMRDPLGYYKILDLTPMATDAEIKQNYRERAKIWHPDHNSSAEATDKFQKLSVAYEMLQDSQSRLFYDLMSQAYQTHNFPDISALKIYKDRAGNENPFIRTISLQQVKGMFIKSKFSQDAEICSSAEAPSLVLKSSIKNWLLGWWSINSFMKNINAIIYNYTNINHNKAENLTLLIHNAIAYFQEKKNDKALASAVQAKEYASAEQKELLDRFIRLTGLNATNLRLPHWNYNKLKLIQLIMPIVLLLLSCIPLTSKVITPDDLRRLFDEKKEITYFQTVEFTSGHETFDDMVVSKILDIPVDYNDNSKLYHTTSSQQVMYGPSDKFDILARLEQGHTVRITGYTPDKKWYRILIDNGNMGFVKFNTLQKGAKNPIPVNSKIIAQ